MIKLFAALALAAATAAPAVAVTYDAYASFNSVQGNGGFTYGATDGAIFTPFAATGNCAITNTICLTQSPRQSFGAFKASIAGVSGTVNVPNDRLILHPGNGVLAAYVAYTVTRSGDYSYSAAFNQQDSNTAVNDVTVTEFYTPFGGATELFPTGGVNQDQPEVFTGFATFLNVGDVIGYFIGNNGNAANDSTGVTFTVEAPAASVPEPATWALAIVGFGLTGLRMRRSTAVAA